MDDLKPLSVKHAIEKLTETYQAYFKARPTFPLWREEFQLGLIEALAKDKDRSVAQVEAQMKQENDQKIMGRNTECIRHKNLSVIQLYKQQQLTLTVKSMNAYRKILWWLP